ncbi:MAG: hypothetical protein K2G41_12140 [Duncaniella sp.]|nr:hypothetical protein [Duncaniella sp.]MBD5313779.1 hypothetical protein [Bacteroides sp.]MBD5334249.1 hypothetical protein [Bacteroides sp.]MDE6091428.1 hypothetical protein [Duncaniella sp.]
MEKNDKQIKKDEQYRGVDVNVADNGKVDPKLVEQETKELNNNPRNNDM